MRNRKRLTFNSTASWTEQEVSIASKFIITRVRATTADAASVAVSIREKSNPTSVLDIPLEYTLTASPLDSEEDVFVQVETQNSQARGTVYIAVKSSISTEVEVLIEYEV